jgi:hypothetical protein
MTARSSIRVDIPILEEKRAVIDRAHNQSKPKLKQRLSSSFTDL